MRDFSLRDFVVSLNTVECYTNESSFGKIGHYKTVNKIKFITFYKFYATDEVLKLKEKLIPLSSSFTQTGRPANTGTGGDTSE